MSDGMHEIRLAGRGGQGVVTAGDLLGQAAVREGKQAQSIPTFGPERRGALSQATLRIGDEEILLKCTTARPDVLVVLDPTIWKVAPVLLGLRDGARLVFNSPLDPEEFGARLLAGSPAPPPPGRYELFTVDATALALEHLGRPITNTAMLGAFIGATGILDMEALGEALDGRFGARADRNKAVARAAHAALRRAPLTAEA